MLNTTAHLLAYSASGFIPVLAQEPTYGGGEFGVGQVILILLLYIYSAFMCQKIFERCGVKNAWFAWIPILGTYANFKAGDEQQPVLWTILSLVPCVNIVAVVMLILAWTRICRKVGKSPWLLLLFLVPYIGSMILLGYLAFT
ncbi:MAG: hypothetical protein Kow00121_38580 [Elainellaceae cyanobacterium]